MGYIDCDSHVIEPAQTWDYFDPNERQFRPMIRDDIWTVEDHVVQWPGPLMRQWNDAVFPGCDLVDIDGRLRHMDDFGVDVQMMYTSWWLLYPAWSPAAEAALHRSYNRWVAERTAEAGGRLRWAVMAPVRTMERAIEELEFGKEHGAASVFLLGQNHGMSLADPTMTPLYEKAQDLDLAITVHVGSDLRANRRDPGNAMHSSLMVLAGSFYAVLWSRLTVRFPRLRWGFVEGGASWVPYVLRETFRADASGVIRSFKDWRASAMEALEGSQLFVAAQIDDNLPEILDLLGPDRLVYGTDYGHLDIGSDPDGMHVITNLPDIDADVARRIVDTNGRRLLGIDPTFHPAPEPTVVALPRERIALGLPRVDVTEKTWFITGTTTGLGREWAVAALDRGDRVAATARNVDRIADLVTTYGERVLPIALDITDRAAAFAAVGHAHRHLGRLDVVVNNAGYGQYGTVEELSEQEMRDQLDTNLFGTLWVTQAALPFFREQGGGHILQISSVGGLMAGPSLGIYHASKWALEGISESLAQEVREFGIRVTIVEPTGYATAAEGSARHATPNPAYERQHARATEIRDSMLSRQGDPTATRAAILAIVDAEEPPLRIILGAGPLQIVTALYESRLATWRKWEDVSVAAFGTRAE